jgi:antitoxin (DNA-binding transcriptional repressor) of toxin-antitoxin stability system
MSTIIDIRELPARWEEALALVASGGEVLLQDGTIPRARLVPCQAALGPLVPGLHPGAMQPTEDFDAPLPDDFWSGNS